MAIEWNFGKMTTGLSQIDDQHQEWIRRLNAFEKAVVDQKGTDALQGTLDFLAQYTETHFLLEEACMRQYNCPAEAANLAAHNVFRGKLAEIVAWVKTGGASTVEVLDLKVALDEWLVVHICTIDVQLRKAVSGA